jgi:hypothetical protein
VDHSSPDTEGIVPLNAGTPLDEVCTIFIALERHANAYCKLFGFFLDNGLGSLLNDGQDNAFILHCCGDVVAHPEPLAYLKKLTAPVKIPGRPQKK